MSVLRRLRRLRRNHARKFLARHRRGEDDQHVDAVRFDPCEQSHPVLTRPGRLGWGGQFARPLLLQQLQRPGYKLSPVGRATPTDRLPGRLRRLGGVMVPPDLHERLRLDAAEVLLQRYPGRVLLRGNQHANGCAWGVPNRELQCRLPGPLPQPPGRRRAGVQPGAVCRRRLRPLLAVLAGAPRHDEEMVP